MHFDLYQHNVLLAGDRVMVIDWPHARRGAAGVDLVMFLASLAAEHIDPEPLLAAVPPVLATAPVLDVASVLDAVLAAHTGFLVNGGLSPMPRGLEPIAEVKLLLGRGALRWLRRRGGVGEY